MLCLTMRLPSDVHRSATKIEKLGCWMKVDSLAIIEYSGTSGLSGALGCMNAHSMSCRMTFAATRAMSARSSNTASRVAMVTPSSNSTSIADSGYRERIMATGMTKGRLKDDVEKFWGFASPSRH